MGKIYQYMISVSVLSAVLVGGVIICYKDYKKQNSKYFCCQGGISSAIFANDVFAFKQEIYVEVPEQVTFLGLQCILFTKDLIYTINKSEK